MPTSNACGRVNPDPVHRIRWSAMIDGIKCRVNGVCHKSLRDRLDFFTPMNEATAELMPYSTAKHRHLFISLSQGGRCSVRGSLHKYAQGGFNGGDFFLSGIREAIAELADLFGTRPESFTLRNLEVGVNLDYPVKDITENVILYGTDAFAPMSSKRGWFGVECELSQHTLKIYGKEGVRLRLEAHADKMQYFLRPMAQPVLTLQHLCEPAVLSQLGDSLLAAWDKVMIRESVEVEGLCRRDTDTLAFGVHPSYWTDLNRENRELFKKRRTRFLELQEMHRTTDRHATVHRMAGEKWRCLMEA